MKVRKAAFALLLLTALSMECEDRAKVNAAVTKDNNRNIFESTSFITGNSEDGYILLHLAGDKSEKEYLQAYFTYNENGLYVDGTDAIPLDSLERSKAYLSLGFNFNFGNFTGVRVLELKNIKLLLAEGPVYWRIINEKGMYQVTEEELADSKFLKDLLPQSIDGFNGYVSIQGMKDRYLKGNIDFVNKENFLEESILKGNITNVNDALIGGYESNFDEIGVNNFKYNEKLYQYITKSQNNTQRLQITANYNFKIPIPMEVLTKKTGYTNIENPNQELFIEGSITFTKTYKIIP